MSGQDPSHPFFAVYKQGFIRVAACRPRCEIADPDFNLRETLELARQGHERFVSLMVFPELGLSGYSIDDLFLQQTLLDAVEQRLGQLL